MTFEKLPNEPEFRDCPACGNPTPANRIDCVHCGHGLAEAKAAEQEAAKANHFIQALFNRSSPFTMIFIGMNAAIFALMWLTGGMSFMSADTNTLVGFGAKVNELIANQHQYWRFVTSVFIHIGLIHLFFNMYALWIIGQEMERLYGSARFVIIYLASGIAGSIGSYLFYPGSVSAGASGALFGLFGAMATFGVRYRKELPKGLGGDITKRVIPVIIINLIFGFSTKIVDNAAHIGGLLSGIALCFIIPYKRPDEARTSTVWRALQAACLFAILASFLAAFAGYNGPPLSLANIKADREARTKDFYEKINGANKDLIDSFNSFNQIIEGRNEKASYAEARQSAERGIKTLSDLPNLGGREQQIRQRLTELLNKQRDLIENHESANPKDWDKAEREELALIGSYKQVMQEFRAE